MDKSKRNFSIHNNKRFKSLKKTPFFFSHFKHLHCKILTFKRFFSLYTAEFLHCRKTHTLKYLHHKIFTLQNSYTAKKFTLQNTYTTKTFAPHKNLHCNIPTLQNIRTTQNYTVKNLHC